MRPSPHALSPLLSPSPSFQHRPPLPTPPRTFPSPPLSRSLPCCIDHNTEPPTFRGKDGGGVDVSASGRRPGTGGWGKKTEICSRGGNVGGEGSPEDRKAVKIGMLTSVKDVPKFIYQHSRAFSARKTSYCRLRNELGSYLVLVSIFVI